MKTTRSILYSVLLLIFAFSSVARANDDNPANPTKKVVKTFTKEDISKIADAYVNNNMHIENAAFVDVDGDGIFDMLVFKKGNVEYYRNTGSLENPYFVLENSHYDKYETPSLIKIGMPMPIFFADTKGDGKLDMFAIEKLDFNSHTNKYDYRVLHAEDVLGLGTGTLITIILVLVIIVLAIAIIH
ncbi:MAG: VCBS repeat-containing protein [Ignavibacteria bacterium]|jgi:hypothetical protein